MNLLLRPEQPEDHGPISDLLDRAFAFDTLSRQNEARIVHRLRAEGKLLLSLIALEREDNELVGQIAFSPVTLTTPSGEELPDWVGLGPMSVEPRLQRMGIGRRLIECGLEKIRGLGVRGCVVLGEPGFYERFGFRPHKELELPGAPAPFFMAQAFQGTLPEGTVTYPAAFYDPG